MLIVLQVITASGTTHTGTNLLRTVGSIFCGLGDIHIKDLITFQAPGFVIALKRELFTIVTPVGFGIIAPKGKLCEIFKMRF